MHAAQYAALLRPTWAVFPVEAVVDGLYAVPGTLFGNRGMHSVIDTDVTGNISIDLSALNAN